MFVSLSDVKTYHAITCNTQDDKIRLFISQAEGVVDQLLGGVALADRSFYIRYEEMYRHGSTIRFDSPFINVVTLKSIDGTVLTSDEYKIRGYKNTEIFIKSIVLQGDGERPHYDIVVTSGYDETSAPPALQEMIYILVGGMLSQANGQTITRKTIGPKTLEFSSDQSSQRFAQLLLSFTPIVL